MAFLLPKSGTNFCLVGDNGGADLQSVYLWLCGATNGNQLWATVFHHQFGATIQLPEGAD